MKNLLSKTFPLQFFPIFTGLAEAAVTAFFLHFSRDIPFPFSALLLAAPAALLSNIYTRLYGKRLYPWLCSGWYSLGFIALALLRDRIIPEAIRPSSVSPRFLALIGLVVLALSFWFAYQIDDDA